MQVSKKAIEQRQEAEARAARIKILRMIDNDLSDKHKYDDHNINEL